MSSAQRGELEPITAFRGDYFFLSNFYPAAVVHDGIRYPTAEHAFQAAKTLDFQKRFQISQLKTPGEAKRAGREVQLRPDWEAVAKDRVMEEVVLLKFSQHPELKVRLLMTGHRHLSEGNTWHDNYWGNCHCGRRPQCQDPGLDRLGQILTQTRELLR